MVAAFGNIPGSYMNFGYLMLRPFALNLGKYIDLPTIAGDEDKLLNFLRMEKWIFDSPDQAGEAWRKFIKDFYQGNKLMSGEVELDGRTVDLRNITMPVLNLYAEQDHLVPPASSLALGDLVGSDDYTVQSFPTGHIGMYVSGKVQQSLPPLIAEWLNARISMIGPAYSPFQYLSSNHVPHRPAQNCGYAESLRSYKGIPKGDNYVWIRRQSNLRYRW